ncbi:hypothetical protein Hanom_Chr04g00300711 [Helianthus anomalus]
MILQTDSDPVHLKLIDTTKNFQVLLFKTRLRDWYKKLEFCGHKLSFVQVVFFKQTLLSPPFKLKKLEFCDYILGAKA